MINIFVKNKIEEEWKRGERDEEENTNVNDQMKFIMYEYAMRQI